MSIDWLIKLVLGVLASERPNGEIKIIELLADFYNSEIFVRIHKRKS